MPFTFSHPAIVLPAAYLNKKWYSFSALIVGSMVPDFEYFMRLRDMSRYSHTWKGLFWFDIPLALLVIFTFHNVVRNSLIAHLPFSLNVRLSAFENFNWNKYFQENTFNVFLSLIAGIASHLIWDDFTHEGGFFVEAIPLLQAKLNIANHNISVYSLLQYGCSLIGAIIVVMAVFKLPEGKKTKQKSILNYWILVSLVTIVTINIRLVVVEMRNYYIDAADVIVLTISGGLLGVIAASIFFKGNRKQKIYTHLSRISNK
jgi:Domain of unknown function (DUF4184)